MVSRSDYEIKWTGMWGLTCATFSFDVLRSAFNPVIYILLSACILWEGGNYLYGVS